MSTGFSDTKTTHIRALVETIERELARATDTASTDLRASWAQLVTVLALGPAPEFRACPTCGQVGMRAASRCIRCWAALVPLPTSNG